MNLACIQKLSDLGRKFTDVNVSKNDRRVGKQRTVFICDCFYLWPCKTYLGNLINLSEPHLFSCKVKKK